MKTRGSKPAGAGFTLIELMVVIALLGLVLLTTATISRDAIELRGITKARVVSERNAAAFLRQFGSDLAQRVNRPEARLRVEKNSGDDEISFLTQRQGYPLRSAGADRRVSLVGYRIEERMLERAAGGYGYGSPDKRPSDPDGTLALAELPKDGPAAPEDSAFQVIAPGLIRLELSFLVREGGNRVIRADVPPDQDQVEAVIATVAALDPDRVRMLTKAQLDQIAGEFPDSADNQSLIDQWQQNADRLVTKLPSLPPSALQQVRVRQSMFQLPNKNPTP